MKNVITRGKKREMKKEMKRDVTWEMNIPE